MCSESSWFGALSLIILPLSLSYSWCRWLYKALKYVSNLDPMCCCIFTSLHWHIRGTQYQYVDGTLTSEVTLVTIWYIHPPHHGHTKIIIMVINGQFPFFHSMSSSHSIPEIRLFQTLTLKLQCQGHGCGQRARSYSQPSFLLIHFLFISHLSDQQLLRYNYFEIWPWKIQVKVMNELRSHNIPSIQLMHFLFVSHQLYQQFLRYGQKNVWPWKNTFEFFKDKSQKKKVSNRISPKSNQVISMIRGM